MSDGEQRDEYEARARRLKLPFVDLSIYRPEATALRLLPGSIAKQHQVLPIKRQESIVFVAVADLLPTEKLDALFVQHGCYARQVLAVPKDLAWAIDRSYEQDEVS